MPDDFLIFTGTVDYADYCSFEVAVGTAGISNVVGFAGYPDTFQKFGRQLVDFPNNPQATVSFEQGEDAGSRQEYLLMQAYYLDQLGHAALRIVMDNKATPPADRRVAFSIAADVSSLMELGRKLLSWQLRPGPASSIEWRPVTS